MIRTVIHDEFRLGRPSVPATQKDISIADDLMETLMEHHQTCVGMAANMIGENVAIIVFLDRGIPREMFNPVITEQSDPFETEEGCLSLSGVRSITRYKKITVAWQDRSFHTHNAVFEGFPAQIIQHEIDHCKGVLI
ncbi:MAG: peptide deformylase [Clostridia bacterium]|nr:peptide deformylase [Clostridia bacterium]